MPCPSDPDRGKQLKIEKEPLIIAKGKTPFQAAIGWILKASLQKGHIVINRKL